MRWLTLIALAGLAAGVYHYRQWRVTPRRLLLAEAPVEPALAVVTMATTIVSDT